MRSLKWSTSDAVWLTEIDDKHREIFEAVSQLQKQLSGPDPLRSIHGATELLSASIVEHFAHEERLMRAARYGSLRWHRHLHRAALRRVRKFILDIEKGDTSAGPALAAYLTGWLRDHSRLADRMMGAFLRNHQRTLCKVTFQAGTKSLDEAGWVDISGRPFGPKTSRSL